MSTHRFFSILFQKLCCRKVHRGLARPIVALINDFASRTGLVLNPFTMWFAGDDSLRGAEELPLQTIKIPAVDVDQLFKSASVLSSLEHIRLFKEELQTQRQKPFYPRRFFFAPPVSQCFVPPIGCISIQLRAKAGFFCPLALPPARKRLCKCTKLILTFKSRIVPGYQRVALWHKITCVWGRCSNSYLISFESKCISVCQLTEVAKALQRIRCTPKSAMSVAMATAG